MTIYGQVSLMPLLNLVAIGFEIPLALAEVAVIGLSFNPKQKKPLVLQSTFCCYYYISNTFS